MPQENKPITNPVKVIRAKCLDCCNGSSVEVSLCPIPDCPCYPFRFGKNPYRSERKLTEEQKAKLYSQLHRKNEAPFSSDENDESDQISEEETD